MERMSLLISYFFGSNAERPDGNNVRSETRQPNRPRATSRQNPPPDDRVSNTRTYTIQDRIRATQVQQAEMPEERDHRRSQPIQRSILFVDRQALLNRIYGLTLIFSIMANVTWLLLASHIADCSECFYYALFAGSVSFLSLTALNVFLKARSWFPLNWLLAFFVVEGLALVVHSINRWKTVWSLILTSLLSAVIIIILMVSGAYCASEVLPGEICFCCTIISLIITLTALIWAVATHGHANIMRNIVIVLMVLIILITLYHAEIIHGRRFGLPDKDFLFCAILVFLDYLSFNLILNYLLKKYISIAVTFIDSHPTKES